MGRILGIIMVALMALGTLAAPQTQVQSSFAKPPAAAAKALRATVGKPFSSGFVFVDGRYLPPPYTVERYGTVIRINGVQVTSEIVPWDEFVKTQSGVTKSESVSEVPSTPEPEPEPEIEEEEEEDDSESSLDDLFDDDPSPKKKSSSPKKRKSTYRPKPKKPTVTVTYSFSGDFEPNERTKAYLDKVNQMRTRIDKHLRAGGYYFFGSRYSAISGDAGAARPLLAKLPELLRDNPNREAFQTAAYGAGFAYMPRALVTDLHRNRYLYPELISRRKAMQEEAKWATILGGNL